MNNFLDKHNLNLKSLDKKAIRLFDIFQYISLLICAISCICLFLYNELYISQYLLEISILIFRAGIMMLIFSFICLIFFSNYLKENGN